MRVVESMVRLGVDLKRSRNFCGMRAILKFGSPELNAEEACTKIEKAVVRWSMVGEEQFRWGRPLDYFSLW